MDTAAPVITGTMGELGSAGAAAMGVAFDPTVPVAEQLAELAAGVTGSPEAIALHVAFEAMGVDFGEGLALGLESQRNRVIGAAGSLATATAEEIAEKLEIGSPSRVAYNLGAFTGEGFALGLEAKMPDLTKLGTRQFDPSRSGAVLAANPPGAPPGGIDMASVVDAITALSAKVGETNNWHISHRDSDYSTAQAILQQQRARSLRGGR